MERRLGVTEARTVLAHIIDEVSHGGESYVIERHGEPAAAVVPIDLYRRWQREREELFAVIHKVQNANVGTDPDQVMKAVLEAQAALRPMAAE